MTKIRLTDRTGNHLVDWVLRPSPVSGFPMIVVWASSHPMNSQRYFALDGDSIKQTVGDGRAASVEMIPTYVECDAPVEIGVL